MKIKRIVNPDEFCRLVDDMAALFSKENIDAGHCFVVHDKESLKKCFAHTSILAWNLFVWGHEKDGKFDSCIMFLSDQNPKFDKKIFSEYLWISKNPRTGILLFKEAQKFAMANGYEYILMSTVVNNPSHEKLKTTYKKLGFLKDSETYIKKL